MKQYIACLNLNGLTIGSNTILSDSKSGCLSVLRNASGYLLKLPCSRHRRFEQR